MANPVILQTIEHAIGQATGEDFHILRQVSAGGGCINSTYRIESEDHSYFVKLNHSELLSMFEAEAEGLREIAATQTVRVPIPVCWGAADDRAFLVMECLKLRPGKSNSDRLLGQKLAALHGISQAYFGWGRDNTIGSTPQSNSRHLNWVEFWRVQRLGFQLKLAAQQGYGGGLQRQGEKLLERLPVFFATYDPRSSLLHGDLWGGNYSACEGGEPVIFDPACYYGDREADIAMTELFGGFGGEFYAAYRDCFPLDEGYSTRKTLYNLYHILNHLNLFGGGYLGQAENMTDRLLAETR
ncbi:MAG: fructosamine kinase family protein [Methylococcaceae bacterium]|nr:fructosamine kinase family protein [Methylococcaceae bacterium]